MTPLDVLLAVGAVISAFALGMTLVNRVLYARGPGAGVRSGQRTTEAGPPVRVSVCIPARNEAGNLEACVRSVLRILPAGPGGAGGEVLVYDDESTDGTPAILAALVREEPRVRAVPRVPLPAGWNGKQHACHRMSLAASGEWLLFTDADVRFGGEGAGEPSGATRAGVLEAVVRDASARGISLVSTFPKQMVGTLAEALAVPMMHFILFGYLPMGLMRSRPDVSLGAGCGQFLLAERQAYLASGGHEGFRASMHDGIRLPRAIRAAGFRSDLFDGSAWCRVRMYRGWRQTWRGFAKNAYEGVGSPGLLVVFTVLHVVGHVLPWAVLAAAGVAWCIGGGGDAGMGLAGGGGEKSSGPEGQGVVTAAGVVAAGLACACHVVQRAILVMPFVGGSWVWRAAAVLLHPMGVLMMTAIQWHSFVLHLRGQRTWKGRGGAVAG